MSKCWDCGEERVLLYSTSDGNPKTPRKGVQSVALCPRCFEAATGEKVESRKAG